MTAAHLTERDSRILDAYFLGQRDLSALAAECGLSHDDLQAWLARPEIQAALEHLDRITAVTRRLRAFDDQMAALAALGDICRHSPCLVERRRAAMAILRGRWMHPPRPRAARPARPARARAARSTPSAGHPQPARTSPPHSPSPPRVEVPPPPRVQAPPRVKSPPPAPPSALNPAIRLTNLPAPVAPQTLPPSLLPDAALAPPAEPAPVFLDILPARPASRAPTQWPYAATQSPATQSPATQQPATQSPGTQCLVMQSHGATQAPHSRATHPPQRERHPARPLDSG